MAEINVERKKKSHWGWIIGALIALLVIWALIEMLDRDEEEAVVAPAATTQVAPVAEPVAAAPTDVGVTTGDATSTAALLPVATILAGPAGFAGQEISGAAVVTDVPTDRGFWIEQDGQRMLALIAEEPGMEQAVNINAGQRIELAGAVVHDQASAAQIAGSLDAQTQQLIGNQPAFLLVEPRDITIVSR
ncbi:hypothetical protein ACFFGH_08105 [Lysobacter korlensis]|uniref:Type II secretion system protein GspC N-terminal domain-containing protein n=1 Tax=Lysobacter korlensis TaxID=553636 RepID=A0ABV6RML3_9GAMM